MIDCKGIVRNEEESEWLEARNGFGLIGEGYFGEANSEQEKIRIEEDREDPMWFWLSEWVNKEAREKVGKIIRSRWNAWSRCLEDPEKLKEKQKEMGDKKAREGRNEEEEKKDEETEKLKKIEWKHARAEAERPAAFPIESPGALDRRRKKERRRVELGEERLRRWRYMGIHKRKRAVIR